MTDEPWRIIADRSDDREAYIPLPPGRRGSDILRKFFEGPTPEQRAAARRWHEQHEARVAAEKATLLARHEELLTLHADGLIARLLHEHGPVDLEHNGRTYVTCGTCDEDAVSWPCPTWTTISTNSPTTK